MTESHFLTWKRNHFFSRIILTLCFVVDSDGQFSLADDLTRLERTS